MTFSAENLAAFDMIKSIPAEDLNACVEQALSGYRTALSPGQPAERRLGTESQSKRAGYRACRPAFCQSKLPLDALRGRLAGDQLGPEQ